MATLTEAFTYDHLHVYATLTPKPETEILKTPELESRDPEPELRISKAETRSLIPENRIFSPET